jgi:hypothetical protein
VANDELPAVSAVNRGLSKNVTPEASLVRNQRKQISRRKKVDHTQLDLRWILQSEVPDTEQGAHLPRGMMEHHIFVPPRERVYAEIIFPYLDMDAVARTNMRPPEEII